MDQLALLTQMQYTQIYKYNFSKFHFNEKYNNFN